MEDHGLLLALGLTAAAPVIVSTIRAFVDGWTPVFDEAVIATRAFDVLTTHSPLVGQYSEASLPSIGPLYDPGPLLYWLLAIPARALGDWSLPATMGAVNVASIMGVVALARRRAGMLFMVAAGAAMVLMLRSLPQSMLHQIDNSRAGVLPFALLLFLAWSVACGEYRLLPLTVLVVSFVGQAHFSLALAGGAALAVALAGSVCSHAGGRESDAALARDRRRWLVGALVVGLICWSGPLLDQALHSPGNLVRMARTASASQKTVGLTVGWHWLVWAVGIPPRWLGPWSTHDEFWKVYSIGTPTSVSAFLILGILSVTGLVGLRRRRVDLAAAAVLGLIVSATIVVAGASLRTGGLVPRGAYALRWIAPVGMFVWLVVGWSVVAVWPSTWRADRLLHLTTRMRRRAIAATPLVALAGTAALAAAVSAGPSPDENDMAWAYRPVHAISPVIRARLSRERAILVVASSFVAYPVQTALIYRLRRDGYRVYAPTGLLAVAQHFGSYYSAANSRSGRLPYDDVLSVNVGNSAASGSGRLIAVAPLHGAPSEFGVRDPTVLTLTLGPATAGSQGGT